jgi:hypothetical protein
MTFSTITATGAQDLDTQLNAFEQTIDPTQATVAGYNIGQGGTDNPQQDREAVIAWFNQFAMAGQPFQLQTQLSLDTASGQMSPWMSLQDATAQYGLPAPTPAPMVVNVSGSFSTGSGTVGGQVAELPHQAPAGKVFGQ